MTLSEEKWMYMESPVEWREPGGSRPQTLARRGDKLVSPGNTRKHKEVNHKMFENNKQVWFMVFQGNGFDCVSTEKALPSLMTRLSK